MAVATDAIRRARVLTGAWTTRDASSVPCRSRVVTYTRLLNRFQATYARAAVCRAARVLEATVVERGAHPRVPMTELKRLLTHTFTSVPYLRHSIEPPASRSTICKAGRLPLPPLRAKRTPTRYLCLDGLSGRLLRTRRADRWARPARFSGSTRAGRLVRPPDRAYSWSGWRLDSPQSTCGRTGRIGLASTGVENAGARGGAASADYQHVCAE